jgi:hypothetical protein
MLLLRIAAGVLLSIWVVLLLLGKGGLVHLILLNALGVIFTDLLVTYRTRMKTAY